MPPPLHPPGLQEITLKKSRHNAPLPLRPSATGFQASLALLLWRQTHISDGDRRVRVCSARRSQCTRPLRRLCRRMQWIPLVATGAALAHQAGAFAVESLKAIRDPNDGDAVAAVGELSSLNSLEYMKACMMADKRGRYILKHQPIIGDELLEYSRGLAPSTFGHRYAAYMDHNHFTPSGRTVVKHIADPTLAYVMTRYRQCHDFLHTLSDCGRSVEEELAVKILEWKHTGIPLGLLAVAGGAPNMTRAQREHIRVYWRWASSNAPCCCHGERAVPMYLNVPWEDMMAKEFDEVVAYTGITPLPVYLAAQKN